MKKFKYYRRTDVWQEGKWLDMWSVVHFLSGVTMGFFPKYLGLDPYPAYIVAFLLLVMYEMFEAMVDIEETPQNRVMDVVVGMVSFVPSYHITSMLPLPLSLALCSVFLGSAWALSAVGFSESKKAEEFEARLRAEFALGKRKLKEERAKIAARMKERKELRATKKTERWALRINRSSNKSTDRSALPKEPDGL